ncbi:HDOD domain-containing protein [Aeoliella mucimassa]|uniref:HDOD domain protein n=1 Tax=Aeoliella mucimassa TaxID=2527972 RepID=A0A518AHE9_9BACT|nr:HDOD domain-containing protein [Aeoliella mucimassa]QDU54149.1 HDOD domain protein [Aeoliella mucimassa]
MPDPSSPLESLIAKAGTLYTLPAVAMEVLQLTNSDRVDTRALKECIERDPALAAKLLKVVNGAMFGLSGKVENLTQAIALLGIKPLKLLVLGFSLPKGLLADLDAVQLAQYWRTALTRAVAARQLAETQWKSPGDDAFLVALLHDIGKLVLLQQVGSPYANFLAQVQSEGGRLIEFEQRSLGFDHRQLTVALLRHWSLPEIYAASIETAPLKQNTVGDYSNEQSIPQILALANLMVELVNDHRLKVLPDLLEQGECYCGLTSDDLSRLLAEVEPRVEQLASVLQVEVSETAKYTEVLLEAHELMSQVATDAAGMLMLTEDQLCAQVLSDSSELQQAMRDFTRVPPPGDSALQGQGRADAPQASAMRGPRSRTTSVEAALATARARLAKVVAQQAIDCREQRISLSLVCIEASMADDGSMSTDAAAALNSALQPLMEEYQLSNDQYLRLSEASIAIVLPNIERREAVELTQRLVRLVDSNSGHAVPPNIKAGAASISGIPKGWESVRLVEAAENCLSAARHAGGSSVKSIEVY